jgi:hypothetical protein
MFSTIKSIYRRFDHWMSYSPPGAMSSEGWNSFNKEFKKYAPIRYWFKNDFSHKVISPIRWKYKNVQNWVRHRTYDRYHVIKTELEPAYHEVERRLLYANFSLLKDFVEVELAWSNYCWKDDSEKKELTERYWLYKYIPFGHYKFREPGIALKHLEWAMTLDDPALPPHERNVEQAHNAREICALYKWWTVDRPARVEVPFSPLPKSDDDDDYIFGNIDRTTPEFKAYSDSVDARNEQYEDWYEEDNQMLHRLIKIRRGLWT